ncbi:MAG: hypothetical protein QXU18_11440 [Thermoplasmatales archaeon]
MSVLNGKAAGEALDLKKYYAKYDNGNETFGAPESLNGQDTRYFGFIWDSLGL